MALIVQKFGGTSVGSIERIEQVANKVNRFRDEGHDVVVVVSAMSGETNRLIGLAHEIQDQPVPREFDVLVSTGEQVTTALLSMALQKRGNKGDLSDRSGNRAFAVTWNAVPPFVMACLRGFKSNGLDVDLPEQACVTQTRQKIGGGSEIMIWEVPLG